MKIYEVEMEITAKIVVKRQFAVNNEQYLVEGIGNYLHNMTPGDLISGIESVSDAKLVKFDHKEVD